MIATQTTNTEVWAIALIVTYFVVLLVTRWLFVARPQQRASEALLDGLEAELAALPGPTDAARLAIARARAMREGEPRGLWRILSWSGARDIAIWRLGHDAQRLSVSGMTFAQVNARLQRARGEVAELPTQSQAYWSVSLRTQWTAGQDADARAALNEFLVELFDARDVKFANLATAQTRVVWIASVGLVVILVLTQHQYDDIFVARAAGAVLARMRTTLQQRDVATDYGLSWSSLALTPVAGALSAWVGLFFVALLQQLDVINLQSLVGTISADDIRNPRAALLGLAILFGFAERLLNRVSDELQDSVTTKQPTAQDVSDAAMTAAGSPAMSGDGGLYAGNGQMPALAGATVTAAVDGQIDETAHYGEESPVADVSVADIDQAASDPALDEETTEGDEEP
jgi:hypothetical protein